MSRCACCGRLITLGQPQRVVYGWSVHEDCFTNPPPASQFTQSKKENIRAAIEAAEAALRVLRRTLAEEEGR
jgi:hypothetical protein